MASKDDTMTCHANSGSPKTTDLAAIYRPVQAELEATKELLREALCHSDPTLNEYLEYSFGLGGKRLRPALLLLCAKSWGEVDRKCCLCAAGLEMIHTGSLIHDDILDGARFRRQLETFNAKWDSHRAVLVGDVLITLALDLICECDDLFVFHETSAKCRATVEGELFQTDAVGDFGLTVDDYRRIVTGKTASLIECATLLGGRLSGARDAELALFSDFGRSIGVAFQIVDDVLDLTGDEASVGKTLGSDLANKKATLPVIFYLQNASESDKRSFLDRVERGVKPEERQELAAILRDSGAVASAVAEANRLVDGALATLEKLRRRAIELSRGGSMEAFDSLAAVARFVVGRDR